MAPTRTGYWRPEEIERLAYDVLARNGVATPPVDVDVVARDEGLEFIPEHLDQSSGVYFRDPNGHGRAIISARTHPLRQRFTKAHELAHHLMDDETVYEGIESSGYRNRNRHWAHEYFAACLLAPRPWVAALMRDSYARGLRTPAIVDRVARTFGISRAAAEVRLRELGHIEGGRTA